MAPSLEMWVLWACITGFVVYFGVRVIADPRNIFSHGLIVSLLVWGILVKSYFDFDDIAIAVLLDRDYYVLTLLYAVLCLLAFTLAYERGLASRAGRRFKEDTTERVPLSLLTLYVAALAAIGFWAQVQVASAAGGLVEFYSESHGSGVDYSQMSAYLHALPNFLWPAMLLGYIGWRRSGGRAYMLLALAIIIAIALFAHTFLFGNRNGIIRFALILGGAWVFINRPTFAKSLPLVVVLLFAVGVVLVLPHLRHSLHLGATYSLEETIAERQLQRAENRGKERIQLESAGHEFFFNVALVHAASVSSTYEYGLRYLFPIVNFVPRAFWPGKPTEASFGVNYFSLTSTVVGFHAGGGAAINAIGHTYLQFSWLGALLWVLVGHWCGRAFSSARDNPTIMHLGFLAASLVGIVFWGTQSFQSSFLGWFFTIVPFWGLRLVSHLVTEGRPHPMMRTYPPRPVDDAKRIQRET